LTLLIMISAVMMTMDHRNHYLDGLRSAVSIIVYPLQSLVSMPFSAGNWLGENMVSRETLLEQVEGLRTQNTFLQAQLQKIISLELENMRLRRLLGASEKIGERVLAADLFAVDFDPFSHKVLIDKGSHHDAYVGQPLLDANGVYGQTVKVSPMTSVVMLITDPSHAIPVQNSRTGLRSIAAGTGSMETMNLLHIPNNADVKVGDLLVSSGLGGVFPAGYPVAEVTSMQPDPSQPYASVQAHPLAKLDRSREVLLVWKQISPELEAAEKKAATELNKETE
jgi:rod shape-determining protein MreC